MNEYNPKDIEPKWQKIWEENGQNYAEDKSDKPKWYSLIEFPYPSGDGLHVGHPRPYIGMDVVSRKRRMQGYNVLYPIGWDAFGLPTENFAIKTGRKPADITRENSDTFRRQIKSLGISFDWSREVNTTDPNYYKWTQWLFLQFQKHGLAYKAKMNINWCPKDKIGLANEEVVDGKCERCGTPVEKREKEQWMLAITKYAERLDKDLDEVDYLPQIKLQQRNWIGRKEGAVIKFDDMEIFTTRPETIFGATFIAVAGTEDKFTGRTVTNPATKEQIPVWEAEYVMADVGTGAIMAVPAHDERDFAFATKHNLPIRVVIEPTFLEPGRLPDEVYQDRETIIAMVKHWSDDKYIALKWKKVSWTTFVTGGIEEGQTPQEAATREITEETGFLNAKFVKELGIVHSKFYHVPKQKNINAHAHILYFELEDSEQEKLADEEKAIHDIAWLTANELENVLTADAHKQGLKWLLGTAKVYTKDGTITNSDKFNRLESSEARTEITKKFGKKVTTFKLRDWIFSRQRYWGEPIPMIYCEKDGWQPVPEKDLPVLLPDVEKYQPTDSGESPLANISEWVNTTCPVCGGPAKRETDTMPNWAGSSWYFLRYADPTNAQGFASKDALKHWMPVDWYNGGMEHTTLHLLYSRFWNKFLFDQGLVPTNEPYKKRTSHGVILAEGGEKMSKSKGNVVNPDKIVDIFGADTLRLYEMFMGPFEQAIAWNEDALVGPRRFIERVWRLREKVKKSEPLSTEAGFELNSAIKKISGDIETLSFNTAVSTLMTWTNSLESRLQISDVEFETLLKLLAPFAPHVTEELWEMLGHKISIHAEDWPSFDSSKLARQDVPIAIQVNGKVRATIIAPASSNEDELKNMALIRPEIVKWLEGREVVKTIVVPGKVVNIVTT